MRHRYRRVVVRSLNRLWPFVANSTPFRNYGWWPLCAAQRDACRAALLNADSLCSSAPYVGNLGRARWQKGFVSMCTLPSCSRVDASSKRASGSNLRKLKARKTDEKFEHDKAPHHLRLNCIEKKKKKVNKNGVLLALKYMTSSISSDHPS